MLADLFLSVTDAVISYTIDKLDPAETLKTWLKGVTVTLAFQKSLARTYSAFVRQYPDYANSLFDQTFLTGKAVPELSKLLVRSQHPDPALLAQAWGESIGAGTEFSKSATKPASDFLLWLEAELKGEPTLQPLFDSRALDNIEAGIEKLTQEIQRGLESAVKSANGYQIQIAGNVTNSNIIVGDNNTVNQYFYSGDFVSLNEYYIPPDGVFQRVRVDEFVGRDWLTAKVDAFLNDPNRKSGAFLLIGDAGVGKTSFMAHLVKERRYLHLFAEQAPGQAMLQRAMQSLGSQLVTRYQIDPYKDRDTLNALSVFPDFLERILRLAASTLTEGEKIVIVCDALDEAGTFPDHFVFGLPKELPDGVYFILSQRPVNVKLPNFEPVIEKLEAQGEGNLQDIESYLSAVAKRPEVAGQIRSKEYSEEFFIQTLKEKSQGVWMYLHYIIKEIESGARAPLDLANLPTGLVGYYAEYWDAWRTGKRGKGEEVWDELYAPLLTTLAAAQEAITVETLIQWANVTVTPREVTRLLSESWRAFITEKEVDGKKAYAPYHLSLKDFITGRVDTDKLPPAQANLVKDLATQAMDAHKRIVNVFEIECKGEWEKLIEQNYPRLHLSAHLNGAGEYEKLRVIFTEGEEKIKWAEAREKKEETYAGYLNDLTYVWVYTEREQNYALAIRCMLIENSIHSLAENIPPELLVELAKAGIWSYARCLSVIRQKTSNIDEEKSLELIIPFLPPLLFQDALLIARDLKYESSYIYILTALAPRLNDELKTQMFVMAHEIKDESARTSALVALAPHLNDELKSQALQGALAAARAISDEYESVRVSALADIVPHLNDEFKLQAFAAACEIKNEYYRANALAALTPYLDDELKSQALAVALEIKDDYARGSASADIAPHLNNAPVLKLQALQEALVVALEISYESERARALAFLAPHLDDELKSQALAAAGEIEDEYYRANVLTALAPLLNDELKLQTLQEALVAALEINHESTRASALVDIAPHLDDELKSQVFQEAFAAALEVKDEFYRARALAELAPNLDDELKSQALHEALAAALEVEDEFYRARALAELAPNLDDELKSQALHEALAAALEVEDEYYRSSALAELAPNLDDKLKSQALQEALIVVRKISNECNRASVLESLAPHLNDVPMLKSQALITAREFKDEYYRTNALVAIAPYLDNELKSQALQEAFMAALEVKDESLRTRVLVSLAPHLDDELKSQALQAALMVVRKINDELSARANTLAILTPFLNNKFKSQALHEALAAALEIEDEYCRASALTDLVPYLNDELKSQALQKALAATHEISHEYESARVSALAALAPHLEDKLKSQILQEALVAARAIGYENLSTHASALEALAPHLDYNLKSQALVAVREFKDESTRASVLEALAPHLNDAPILKSQALATAREFKDEYYCTCALAALAPYLDNELKSQVLQEAFAAAFNFKDEYSRASALADIVPHLDDNLKSLALPEALAAALEINIEFLRSRVLASLAPHLNNKTQNIVLQKVLYVSDSDSLSSLGKVLNTLEEIEFEGLQENIISFIKFMSQKNRKTGIDVLGILTPALIHFRGPEIADELYRTITDVTRWWQ